MVTSNILSFILWRWTISCEIISTRPAARRKIDQVLYFPGVGSHRGGHLVVVGNHGQRCPGPAIYLACQLGCPRHYDSDLLSPDEYMNLNVDFKDAVLT